MINISIIQMQQTGYHCSNPKCEHNPKHMINILGNVWYIKVDTSVAFITLTNGFGEYYCRGCIDEIYQIVKLKLDSSLWAFH
jgi:hypothetical protein